MSVSSTQIIMLRWEIFIMANGMEKRRFKRMKADLKLNVSSLFNQDNKEIKNLDSPITVTNISEGGIAFESKSMLPINFYFNAALNLGFEPDTLYSVIKIIRSQPIEGTDNYLYGCEFVGMAPILGYIFDEYEAELEKE